MSDEYTPEAPEAVIPPEVVVDDVARPYKAYASAALGFLVTFVGIWVADVDPFTGKEIASAAVAGLVASGVVGLPTFFTPNPKVTKILE